jgi:hypothetical protein
MTGSFSVHLLGPIELPEVPVELEVGGVPGRE